MPTEDPQSGAEGYAQIVVKALGEADDVIVVGQSMGGLTVPVVASMRPVQQMIFLSALVPWLRRY
jgi:esterase/lipase